MLLDDIAGPLSPADNVVLPLALESPAPPVLQDFTSPMGSLTAIGYGNVNLADVMAAPGSGEITSWQVAWQGGTASNHFTTTNDGKSPTISSNGRGALSGEYRWTVTATGPGGTSTARLIHTAVADAATIGNWYGNYPGASIGDTPSGFYNSPSNGRRLQLAVGLNLGASGVRMGQDFDFPGLVTVEYADPARPSLVKCVTFGGNARNIRLKGLKARGRDAASEANFYLSGSINCSIVDCEVLNTAETFDGTNAHPGILVAGTSTTGMVIDNCKVEHTFRGVWLHSGSATVTNTWVNRFHGQAFFVGNFADGMVVDDCVASNPYRTPGDTGNHLDFFQLADAGSEGTPNKVAQNVTVRRCMFVMGNANSGLRGFAGGAGSATSKVAGLVIDRCIWTTWGVDAVEIYGFAGACSLTKQVMIRMLTGDDSFAPFGATKDHGVAAARLTISPPNAANVDGTSALSVSQCWVENDTNLGEFAAPKTTFGADYYRFLRAPLSAGNGTPTDSVGFAAPNPRAVLESFDDWGAIPLATLKGRLFSIFRRADGKGPVNATGDGWNS